MKISTSPYGFSESYEVKFWYTNHEGYWRQTTEMFYCNSKVAHKHIEKYAFNYLSGYYYGIKIISVTYQ